MKKQIHGFRLGADVDRVGRHHATFPRNRAVDDNPGLAT